MCLNWMLLNELLGWTIALKTTIQSSGEYKFSDGGPILALWRQKNQRGRTVQNFRERGQYKKRVQYCGMYLQNVWDILVVL
uniref:Putative secreted protein n=1 Tax=Xenopsylla cheopis TaxID=163159 RepID=A0A6M2E275_XENCH